MLFREMFVVGITLNTMRAKWIFNVNEGTWWFGGELLAACSQSSPLAFPCPLLLIKGKHICRGADKSLAFHVFYFPICSTTKRIFLGWVKEVRMMKS
jgi:hypothetical protein